MSSEYTGKVAAVVIPRTEKKEEFLIAKRNDSGEWEFPGGKQEKGENLLETAEREILEELNLNIEAIEKNEYRSYRAGGYEIVPVLAEHSYGNPDSVIELEDHTDYRWIDGNSELAIGKERKCLEAFGLLMSEPEEHEVVKVLVRDGERFLALRKSDGYDWKAGKWEIPGGKIKPGESKSDAVQREIKAETGLELDAIQELVRIELEEPKTDKPLVNCHIVVADGFSGDIVTSEEHKDYRWVTAEEFSALDWHRDSGYNIPVMKYIEEYLDE